MQRDDAIAGTLHRPADPVRQILTDLLSHVNPARRVDGPVVSLY
jgi:hypothetical protein